MERDVPSPTREAADLSRGASRHADQRLRATHLKSSVSRRVLMETFEPRLLLSADLLPIAGTIAAPGEEDSYRITFAEPTRVSFDTLTENELSWRLTGPGDTRIGGTLDRADTSSRSVPAVLDVARGTYTLSISGAGSQTGDYEFALNDLADAPDLSFAAPVAVSLPRGTESRSFVFDAEAGEVFSLVVTGASDAFGGTFTLVTPGGDVATTANITDLTHAVTETGRYTLLVDGRLDRAGPLDFTMRAGLVAPELRSYTPGTERVGTFRLPGERHVYAFTLDSDTQVTLSGSTGFGLPQWELRGPLGRIDGGFALPATPTTYDLEAGDYWFVATGQGGRTGDYRFTIAETGAYAGTPAQITDFPATLGADITGTLTATGQVHRHEITLGTRTQVMFEMLDRFPDIAVTLESAGGQVFSIDQAAYFSFHRHAADLAPGTYWLNVRAKTDSAGAYRLRLSDIFADAPPVTPGEAFTVELGADASVVSRSVTLTAGDRVYFDPTAATSSTGSGNGARVLLFGPDGNQVETLTGFISSGSGFFAPRDGVYRLEFRRNDVDRIESFTVTIHTGLRSDAALTLDALLDIRIETPGQIIDHAFEMTDPGRVTLDLIGDLGGGGNMILEIIDAEGNVLLRRGATTFVTAMRADLAPGTYTLRASGSDDAIAAARIALRSDASARTLPRGVEQAGSLGGGGALGLWSVEAAGRERITLDFTEFAGVDAGGTIWSIVYGPNGEIVRQAPFNGTPFFFDATRAGRYTILIDPVTAQSGAIDYRFTARTAPADVTPLTLGARVDGSIAVPFERANHSFSLEARTQLYFDSLTNSPATVTIYDANGAEVANGPTTAFNQFNHSGRAFALGPGDYRLEIEGTGAGTFDYGFVLRDLGEVTAAAFGEEITQTVGQAASVYLLDVAAPGPVTIDSRANGVEGYWQVIDPLGRVVAGPSTTGTDLTFSAVLPGQYTLVLDERADRDAEGDVTFRVTQPEIRTVAITPGTPVSGTLANPGDTVRHSFTLATAERLVFDSQTNTNDIRWWVEADGVRLSDPLGMRNHSFDQAQLDLPAGAYDLVIEGQGSFVGDFAFELLRYAQATPLADNVATGEIVLTPSTGARLFSWEGTAGQIVEFDSLLVEGDHSFAIYDPFGGRVLEFNSLRDVSDITLRHDGTYTVIIAAYITNTQPSTRFAFAMRETGRATPEVLSGTPLAVGELASGTLADNSETASFLLTLTERSRLVMDGQVNLSNVQVTLSDALGRIMAPRNINRSSPVPYDRGDRQNDTALLDLGPGQYRIDVTTSAAGGNPYRFVMLDADGGTDLPPGAERTLLTDPASSMQLFRFDAARGDHVALDMVNAGDGKRWYVIAPDGTSVADGNFITGVTLRAPQDGRYVLVTDGHANETIPSDITVTRRDNAPTALTLGAVTTAVLPVPGMSDAFIFDLGAETSLLFDNRDSRRTNLFFSITDAAGRVVAGSRSDLTDGQDFRLPAGSYTLTLSTNTALGEADFRLLDLGAAPRIALGEEIAGSLPVTSDRFAFGFDAVAGQEVLLDRIDWSQSTFGAQYRLIAPDGRELPLRGVDDVTPFTLDQSGRWTVLLLPANFREGPLDYRFRLVVPQITTGTLDFGERLSDTLPDTGGRLVYSFDMASAGDVYFDSGLSDFSARWTLRDASGAVVGTNRFDLDKGGNSRVWLDAGPHTLTLHRTDDAVTELPFRLLRLDAVPKVAVGSPIRQTLDPGNVTQALRFDAVAGQRLAVALGTARTFTMDMRIIGPGGREVLVDPDISDDGQLAAIERSGEHILLFEGDIGQTNAQQVEITLIDTALRAPVAITSATAAAPDLEPSALTVSAAGPVQAGGPITVGWTVTNTGSAASTATGRDRVLIRRADTGQIVAATLTDPGSAPLVPGAALTRQAVLTLPSGALGAGDLVAEVELDIANAVNEVDGGLGGESNNTATLAFTALNDRLPDLLVENIRAEPAGGYAPGDTVTVRWTLRNAGEAAVDAAFTDQLRLRNLTRFGDPTLELLTLAYDPAAQGAIAPGATVERSATLTWPEGLDGTGEMGFDVTTDVTGVIAEDNAAGDAEDNNTTQLAVINAPDLVIEGLAVADPDPQAGDTVTFTWTVRNAGNAGLLVPFRSLVQAQSLATGQFFLNQRIDFAEEAGVLLPAGESRARSLSVALPAGASGTGDIRFRVFLDNGSSPSVTEVNAAGDAEANNNAEIRFASRERALPDLTPTAPSITGTAVAGRAVTVAWQVSNSGDAAAPARADRLILSRDDTPGGADDVILASVDRAALDAGGTDAVSLSVALPSDLEGAYSLFVVTDADDAVIEGDGEADNTSGATAVTVLPAAAADLVVEAVAGPTAASLGAVVPVSWRVGNAGAAPADAAGRVDRVYLSTDTAFDGGDILLAEVAAPAGPLAVGESYTASADVTIPAGTTGTWRIIVVTDATDAQDEGTAEDNNTGAALEPLTISVVPAADLQPSGVSGPADASPGDKITVTWRTGNTGEAAAEAPFTDRLYLTQTGGVAGARFLGDFTHTASIPPGEGRDAALTVTMPSLPPGIWRFLVVSDVFGQVFEAGRGDNNDALADAPFGLATPDFVVSNLSAPERATSDDVVTVAWTVTNTGAGNATGGRIDRILLSRDGIADGNDIVLHESAARAALAPGEADMQSADIRLPIDARGEWQILVVADAQNANDEQEGEDNNTIGRDILIDLISHADLVVTEVTAPPLTVADPATITVSWRVSNTGDGQGAETGWTDEVRASRDGVIGNADDFVLGRFQRDGALAPGESYLRSEALALPAGLSERLVVYVVADAEERVFEDGQRDNNSARVPGPVDVATKPYADLKVVEIEAAPSGVSGTDLEVAWTVRNDGIGITDRTSWTDEIRLSRNPDGSGEVASARFTHLGTLAVGDSYRRSAVIGVPNGISGTFYVTVKTADGFAPYEFIFDDNNVSEAAETAISLAPSPDLRVTDIATLASAAEGQVIDVAWRVSNAGAAPLDGTWTDRLLLVPADTSRAPIAIGSFTNTRSLGVGESYQRTERFRLPQRIEGAYTLTVVTNVDRGIFEEGGAADNNTASDDRPIEITLDPRPNLQVASVVASPSVSAGGSQQATFEIINQGSVAATGTWEDRVYLSLDDRLSSDDILISRTGNPLGLAPGESYSITSDVGTVPLRWSGEAYVIVSTDALSQVDEYPLEDDNQRSTAFEVSALPRPDLVTGSVVAPAQAVFGSEIELRYTVTNRGAGATLEDRWRDTIWIARDARRPNTAAFADVAGADFLKGNSARLLATVDHVGTLEVGESYEMTVRVRIPDDLPSGQYFITPWSDSFDVVAEDTLAININPDDPNELDNNNYKGRAIDILGYTPVRPDLTVSDVTTDAPVVAGSDGLTVNWRVSNTGLAGTPESWIDRVYLSDRAEFGTPGETLWLLGDVRREGALGAGEAYNASATFDLPPSAEGQYVHVITDASVRGRQAVVEEDEDNNVASGAAQVTNTPADLRVIAVTAAEGARSGEPLSVSWTVRNAGGDVWEGTQYWRDSVWLSRDPVFDRGRATFLGSAVHDNSGGLAAGASYTETLEVDLPAGTDGDYFLHVATDVGPFSALPQGETRAGNSGIVRGFYQSSVYETDEDPTGNFGRGSLDIVFAEPDLQVTAFEAPGTGSSGAPVTVSYTVTNTGNRATREDRWPDRFFISVDGALDPRDHLIGEVIRRAPLAPGESYSETVTLDLPLGIAGDFTILMETDAASDEGGSFTGSTVRDGLRGLSASADAVPEFAGEGNNRASAPISVEAAETADLGIGAITLPQRGVTGQPLTVRYEIVNTGARDTGGGWRDLIYLSRDESLDPRTDFFLGFHDHLEPLEAGARARSTSRRACPRGCRARISSSCSAIRSAALSPRGPSSRTGARTIAAPPRSPC